jgi:hypothetical protein
MSHVQVGEHCARHAFQSVVPPSTVVGQPLVLEEPASLELASLELAPPPASVELPASDPLCEVVEELEHATTRARTDANTDMRAVYM